jgi:all-trans-retinol dehydrogenase (NAD+)
VLVAPNAHFLRVDLTSGKTITDVAQRIRVEHGEPTILINNAGIINKSPILSTPDENLVKLFTTNTLAYYRVVREFVPAMVSNNHGMIVTMASVASYVTPAGMTDYSSSKSAAIALHEGITSELTACYNAPMVRTLCVVPNFVRTRLAQGLVYNSPFVSPMLEPETVAEAVIAKVLTGRGGWVVLPKSAEWFGMVVRCWPWWMQRLLAGAIADVAKGTGGRKDSPS